MKNESKPRVVAMDPGRVDCPQCGQRMTRHPSSVPGYIVYACWPCYDRNVFDRTALDIADEAARRHQSAITSSPRRNDA